MDAQILGQNTNLWAFPRWRKKTAKTAVKDVPPDPPTLQHKNVGPGSPTLQQLHRLEISSPDFHTKLRNVLYGEEYVQCVLNLQGNDVAWLVDYLCEVRSPAALPHFPLRQSQVLDRLDPSSDASRKCLCELRNICGTNAILPTSYTLSSDLNIDPDPFASGGFGDVYKGTLGGSRICVKRVRVYTRDGPERAERVPRYRPSPCP